MDGDAYLELLLQYSGTPLDRSSIKRSFLDIQYAEASPTQKLDLYLPEDGQGPFPTVVFVHGGAFMFGDKAENQLMPFLFGLYRGYAVAGVNYRLSGEACFPAGLQDVKAAIRYLRANADRYNLDPGRFAAGGGSAGGNLSAMVCVTGNTSRFDDEALGNPGVSSAVQAGVIWFPPTDFSLMDGQIAENGFGAPDHSDSESPESKYLGGTVASLPEEAVQAANPMTYVHSEVPPMLIQHGRKDRLVPYQQSVIFAEKISAVAGPDKVRLDLLEHAEHADIWFETVGNMQKVFAFLDEVM